MAEEKPEIVQQLQQLLEESPVVQNKRSGDEDARRDGQGSKRKNLDKETTILERKSRECGPEASTSSVQNNEESKRTQEGKKKAGPASVEKKRSAAEKQNAKETRKGPVDKQRGMVDPDLTPEIQLTLENECIFPLKKKSSTFPQAKYHCRLCDYHCDNILVCQKHIKDTRHKRLSMVRATDIMLKSLPRPSCEHSSVLSKLVSQIYETHGLSEDEINLRQRVLVLLSETMGDKFPGVTLNIYGSTAMGFGLNSSNLNIELRSEMPATNLADVFLLLRDDKSGNFLDVRSDFSSKVPSVLFRTPSLDKITVRLGIGTPHAFKTSRLLALYGRMDQRLPVLATAFRYFAKLVKIDEQEAGTLPSYVFYLMTVYYLQQCQPPVLPVLQQMQAAGKKGPDGYLDDLDLLKRLWKCENNQSLGELWVGLLKFYAVNFDAAKNIVCIRQSKPLTRKEKKWMGKRIGIEDPFEPKKRNVAKSVSHSHIYEYIDERFRSAYLYFGNPQTKNGPLFARTDLGKLRQQLRENLKHVHEASQRSSPQTTGAKTPDSDKPAKDDFSDRQGKAVSPAEDSPIEVSGAASENDGEQFIPDGAKLKSQLISTSANQRSQHLDQECDIAESDILENSTVAADESCAADNTDVLDETAVGESEDEFQDAESEKEKEPGNDSKLQQASTSKEADSSSVSSPTHGYKDRIVGLFDESLLRGLTEDDFTFAFTEQTLYDGKGPAIMCQICQKEGHLKIVCPEENLPAIKPLPPLTPDYANLLEHVLWRVPEDFKPSEREKRGRMEILHEVEEFIQESYSDARVETFGSSCNGFGFRDSDLDLCLTFEETEQKDVDSIEVIEDLAQKMKKHRSFYQVCPITSAKVPIVKFRHRSLQVEGDISLYNTLGTHNTRLLYMYSQIDPRVQAMGYIMKVFAKLCDIGDASRGSLSSYAYIIMVIYYLQQCQPPVLPVLQELHDQEKPTVMVDGWNTWFYDDMKNLGRRWPGLHRNDQSLAELWVGLLRFFSVDFNWKDYVICIRQLKPLTRFEKLWNGTGFCIEDPFDLSHNLGGGVSRKMSIFIRKTLRNGYLHHGSELQDTDRYPTPLDYLFDRDILTDSEPPNDRGCRLCGKIGHFARDCSIVIRRKERQAKEREERDMMRRVTAQHERKHQHQHHQVTNMMNALVVNDADYRMQQERARNQNQRGPAAAEASAGGGGLYNRSFSQGATPTSRQLVSNGSPRAGGYVNSSAARQLTWQQEQVLQQQYQRQYSHHHPAHQSHHQRWVPTPHYHHGMQSPHSQQSPYYHQQHQFFPASSQQQPQWFPGSTGGSDPRQQQLLRQQQQMQGHAAFYPQHKGKGGKRPSEASGTSRVVQSDPTEGKFEIELAGNAERGQGGRRNRGPRKRRKGTAHRKHNGQQSEAPN